MVRSIDINTQGAIREYRPHTHKGEHHDKEGVVFLGPHAQAILKPWLKTDLHAYVFSPAEGRAWYQTLRAANRKTPKPRGRQSSRKKSPPMRAPGDHYTSLSYGHAVQRACEVAYLGFVFFVSFVVDSHGWPLDRCRR